MNSQINIINKLYTRLIGIMAPYLMMTINLLVATTRY